MKITGTVYKRKDTGRWGASLYVDKVRIRQETHFETKTAAKEARQTWENELLNGRYIDREQESVTVAELLKFRREELVRQGAKSLETFDANSKAVNLGPKNKASKVRRGGLGKIPAASLTAGMVDEFRDRCIKAGLAKSTTDKHVEELRAALKFAVEKGRLARAPKLSFFKPDNRRTGFFEPKEHEATGHRSDSVFERYAIMTEREKEQGLARLEEFRAAGGSREPATTTAAVIQLETEGAKR